MIQDITPYRFHNEFQKKEPAPENYFFSFREQKILLLSRQDGEYCLPTFRDLQQTLSDIANLVVYLFSIDDIPLYLVKSQNVLDLSGEPLEGVNKIAKTIENKGFSRKGKADGKNFVRWKPLHILERCKEKRQGKTAVRHGLGIVFKL